MSNQYKGISSKAMYEVLNALRLARKESSQAFNRVSYHAPVQPIFDLMDQREEAQKHAE